MLPEGAAVVAKFSVVPPLVVQPLVVPPLVVPPLDVEPLDVEPRVIPPLFGEMPLLAAVEAVTWLADDHGWGL